MGQDLRSVGVSSYFPSRNQDCEAFIVFGKCSNGTLALVLLDGNSSFIALLPMEEISHSVFREFLFGKPGSTENNMLFLYFYVSSD